MNYTKKISLMIGIIMIIGLFSQSVLSVDSPTLKTTLLRYEPSPAKPDGYITVYVQVENVGNGATTDAKLQFVDSYPFTMDNALDKTKDVGTLGVGQTLIADFKVRVDDKAIYGTNNIKFLVSAKSLDPLEKLFEIQVKSLSVDLNLKSVEVTPKSLSPGDSGKISITLRNSEDSTLSGITTKILTYSIIGSTVTDLPFAIEDSVSKKYLSILKSGDEGLIEYSIKSYPSIKPGIYKIPLTIDFFDSTGQNYTKTEFITMVINPKVDAYITIDSSSLTADSKIGNVVFKIINKGFGQIQFANMVLVNSSDFEILSPYNQVYIGSIDSDDYKTGEFKISAKKDKLDLSVMVTFKDSLNNDHELNQIIPLTLLTNTQTGQKTSNNTWIIIVLVLIVGVGIWYYKKKK